jgi:hypothetical protein
MLQRGQTSNLNTPKVETPSSKVHGSEGLQVLPF